MEDFAQQSGGPQGRRNLRWVGQIMFKGLVAILPAALTLYAIFWLIRAAEQILGGVLEAILPESWYLPGMGLASGMLLVFLLGLALNAFLVRRLFALSEGLMNRLPVIKTLYGSVKDFVGFFAHKKETQFNQVVTVEIEIGGMPMRLLGLVTCADFRSLPPGIGSEGEVAVYLPLSYQIGGMTVIVPRDRVRPVDISVHRAMGFIVTGGVAVERSPAWGADASAEGQG